MKRFLGRRQTSAKNQDNTPEYPPRKIFPSGIELLYGPDDGTIEYVLS
jgi:hypothetical protein